MKMKSNLVTVVSLVTLMSALSARADDAAATVAPEVVDGSVFVLVYPTDEVINVDAPADVEVKPVDEGVVEEVVVTEEGDAGTPTEGEEVVVEDGEVTEIPLDWIKRGSGGEEGENPVIYYNMAGGPVTGEVSDGASNSASSNLGQEDRATEVEAKANVAAPSVKGQKKGPVAVVKKGRVFLR
jgi:hypothetical protein